MSQKQQSGKPQQPPISVNEQVSLILAHTNRAITQVSKEAELAVMKVVASVQEGAIQYGALMEKYQELKEKYEPVKKESRKESKTDTKQTETEVKT